MSTVVSLEKVKLSLRITNNKEDVLLQLYIDAVTSYITNFLNSGIPGLSDSPEADVPADIQAAALMIINDLYENREGQIITKSSSVSIARNPRVDDLLYPYRTELGL